MITQRLQPSTVSHPESQSPNYRPEETERTNSLVLWGLIVMFVGAGIGVVGKKLMYNDLVTVIGVLVALAGMFLSVYPYVSHPSRSKQKGSTSSESELQGQSGSQKSLPQERPIEYVPTVTEGTTELLTNPVVPRSRDEAKESQD